MNDSEFYTIEGVRPPIDLFEWANSHSNLVNLPAQSLLDITTVLSNDESFILAPLDMIPFRSQDDDWTITAILERENNGVRIDSDNWQDGHIFWLKENARVHCNWPILIAQISEVRNDLIFTSDELTADAHVLRPIHFPTNSDARIIHPLELVGPAGFNSVAIVCNQSDINLRRQLMAFHHAPTAICTNVERKLSKQLLSKYLEVGVQCFQDQHQRYQLAVCAKNDSEIHRYTTIQNSWVGLHESALKFFELTV